MQPHRTCFDSHLHDVWPLRQSCNDMFTVDQKLSAHVHTSSMRERRIHATAHKTLKVATRSLLTTNCYDVTIQSKGSLAGRVMNGKIVSLVCEQQCTNATPVPHAKPKVRAAAINWTLPTAALARKPHVKMPVRHQ